MKRFNTWIDTHGQNTALLLGRLWFGLVMAFSHGWSKFSDLTVFNGKVAKMGFFLPEITGTFAATSEFIGGILIACGLFFRPAVFSLLVTMLAAAFFVHAGDPFGKREYALSFCVVCVMFLCSGPGRFSVSAWWRSRGDSEPESP